MNRLNESALLAAEILRNWAKHPARDSDPVIGPPRGAPATDTCEEERLELIEAVLEDLRREDPGRDRLAACRYLLGHLSRLPASVS